MDGKFTKKLSPILAVMFILGAILLVIVPIKLNQWPDVTKQFYTMAMVLWGLGLVGFAAFWIAIVFSNRGAYLELRDHGIRAKYGYGTRLECCLDDITYIALGPAMVTLEAHGKLHDITGLTNVGQIAQWLKSHIGFAVPRESHEELLAQRSRDKLMRKKWILALVILCAMMFVEIALLAWATDGQDLHKFTGRNVVFFYIFVICEIATIGAVFFCGNRGGKYVRRMALSHDKLRCKVIATAALPEGDAIGVFYDGNQRLTLFADPQDRIYYILETLGPDYTLSISQECDPTHDTYEIDKKIDTMRDIGFLFGME